MNTNSPTLLEIACSFELWQEYADPSNIDSQEQFESRSASQNLKILQECTFSEKLVGDLYSDDGFFACTAEIKIMPASLGEKPSIRFGAHVCLTEACDVYNDKITGPGGWYVIVRGTEEEEE